MAMHTFILGQSMKIGNIRSDNLRFLKFFFREAKKGKEIQYLVKWKELGYDQATWEFKEDVDNKDIL